MGLYESIQRSQPFINDIASSLHDYMQKERLANMYSKLRELSAPQTTFSGGDRRPTENVAPAQGQPTQPPMDMRTAMQTPKQPAMPENLGPETVPVSPSSRIQPTPASQTGEINTHTPSKREALKAYLSGNPPQTQEDLQAIKQYADLLDLTEPKPIYQMIPKDATLTSIDERGNVTPVAVGQHQQGNLTPTEMYFKDAQDKVANDPDYKGKNVYEVARELEAADKKNSQRESKEIPTGNTRTNKTNGAFEQEFTMGDPVTGNPVPGANKFWKSSAPNQTTTTLQDFENFRGSKDYNDAIDLVGTGSGKISTLLSGFRTTPKQKMQFAADIRKKYPDWKEYTYDNDKLYKQQFIPGKPIGNKIANLNTAIVHTGEAIGLVDKLGNNDAQFINGIKNWVANNFGTDRAEKINSFDAVKAALSGELSSLFKGGNAAATDAEIDNLGARISSAQKPAALKDALLEFLKVGKQRIDQYTEPYNARFDENKDFLNEQPRKYLQSFGIIQGGGQDKQTPQTPLTNSKGWKLYNDAKGNQAYVSPDGTQFEEVK